MKRIFLFVPLSTGLINWSFSLTGLTTFQDAIPFLQEVTKEDQSEPELEGGTTPPSSKDRRQVELAWKDFQSMRARLNIVFRTKTGVAALTQASHPEVLGQVRASRRRATVDCGQFQGGRREV